MFFMFFIPALLQFLAIVVSIVCAAIGTWILLRTIQEWRNPEATKIRLLVVVVVLLVISGFLYHVWVTEGIMTWRMFSFAMASCVKIRLSRFQIRTPSGTRLMTVPKCASDGSLKNRQFSSTWGVNSL